MVSMSKYGQTPYRHYIPVFKRITNGTSHKSQSLRPQQPTRFISIFLQEPSISVTGVGRQTTIQRVAEAAWFGRQVNDAFLTPAT
jgi:hypothetical protein